MGTKVKETCTVISQECIGKDIYSMWLQTKTIAGKTGTVCLRIYTGWGQAASPSYQPV